MAREDDVDDDKSEAYMKLIEKRSTRIPLQYITGEQNFMGYDLIPQKMCSFQGWTQRLC